MMDTGCSCEQVSPSVSVRRRRRRLQSVPAAAVGGLAPYRLKRVLERIESGLADRLSLERLSAEAGLNATHFSRAFKQSFGVPPHRHLVRRRLERARDLLASTNLSILQVALEVGYGSHSHFTTAFRKSTGLTPREFRSRTRN
jgi:AraC family transcriptional regulator